MFANWAQCYFKAKEVIGSGVLVPVRIQLLRRDGCLSVREWGAKKAASLPSLYVEYVQNMICRAWNRVLTQAKYFEILSAIKYRFFLPLLHLDMLIGFNMKIVFRTVAYLIICSVFKSTFISVLYRYVLLRQCFFNWVQWVVPRNSANCTTCHLVFCP